MVVRLCELCTTRAVLPGFARVRLDTPGAGLAGKDNNYLLGSE